MGVKHGREYEEIISELADAMVPLGMAMYFLRWRQEEWSELDEEQCKGLMEVLADDVFYALGEESVHHVGGSVYVAYRPKHHMY